MFEGCVVLLNICETVPQCPYDFLVLNTSGSLYSLVKKTPENVPRFLVIKNRSLATLYNKYNKESQLPSDEYSRSRDFPVANTLGSNLQYTYKLLTKIQNLKTYPVISIATKPLGDLPALLLDYQSLYEKCLEIFSNNLII
jgi:hypothetical protein